MRFDFKLIPQADLEERLRYVFDTIGKQYDAEAISAIARAGAGSVRDMLSIADTCVSYTTGKLTYADVNAVLGNADFSEVGKLCKGVLEGNSGEAFARTEGFLSAGKSVGMLLKDVLNFLNACTVARTCRDGKEILALPDELYAEVTDVAKVTDGHRLLRTTEIFAKVESEVKYSASPRILFETAVLKASLPQEDYDIEALIARVAALEERIKNGVAIVNEGGMSATNTDKFSEPPAPITEADELREEYDDFPQGMDIPPEEENAYFDSQLSRAEEPAEKPAPVAPPAPVRAARSVAVGDSKSTLGAFLRSVRKTAKNGVLIALCMDLDGEYEGDRFLLYTDSDTVYRSLKKEEHFALLTQAFAAIGVEAEGFDIRLKGKDSDVFERNAEEIRRTFAGVNVEIK